MDSGFAMFSGKTIYITSELHFTIEMLRCLGSFSEYLIFTYNIVHCLSCLVIHMNSDDKFRDNIILYTKVILTLLGRMIILIMRHLIILILLLLCKLIILIINCFCLSAFLLFSIPTLSLLGKTRKDSQDNYTDY